MTIIIQNYSLFNAWKGCLRLGTDYRNINFFPEAIYLAAQVVIKSAVAYTISAVWDGTEVNCLNSILIYILIWAN